MKAFFPVNADEEKFCRRISDLLYGRVRFTAFLTEREQSLARLTAEKANSEYSFWGGYENAERKMFCSCLTEADGFPVEAITFTFRAENELTHRDFLGALMNLGTKRDRIGDILVDKGAAIVFVSKSVSEIILNEISKVRNIGVKSELGINVPIPEIKYEEKDIISASLRIDSVISVLCGISRERSAALVRSGDAIINGVQRISPSENLEEGDKFSIRGYGKFIVSEIGSNTKKGKLHIIVKKYK